MKKTIIVTHGYFGRELIKSAEMIIGPVKNIYIFSVIAGSNIQEIDNEISMLINNYEETYIFVDIAGGTPYNITAKYLKYENIELVTGVNLPVILEYFTNDDVNIDDLEIKGRYSIMSAKKLGRNYG